MTAPEQENTQQIQQNNDKELNFRRQEEALRNKYERQLEQERQARLDVEKKYMEATAPKVKEEDEDEGNNEPYVEHKSLNKKLSQYSKATQNDIQKAMEQAKVSAKEELKQEMWLEANPDFHEVLQHSEKFHQRAPKLAENILRMPEGFERAKLVYYNIKELGLDKPETKAPSIQDKVDANRRSPYYQPTGVGAAPHSQVGDFSISGQKNAYDKMQELKSRLRIG